jgi:hypothetical protein
LNNKIILAIASVSLFASSVMADSEMFSKNALSVKAGTLGAGLELTTSILDNVNARVGVNGFKYSTSGSKSNIDYDIDLKLLTVSLLLDYSPFEASQFRLTGGAMYNGNKLDMTGNPAVSGTFNFNGTTYTTTDVSSVDATVDFNKFAPYLGIGWGNAVKSAGWNFVADLGVMFQGNPDSSISVNTTLTGTAKTALLNNVAAEQSKLDDDLDGFKYYPVASIGVSYRF